MKSYIVESQLTSLEILTKVAAKLDILKVVNISNKSRYNTNNTSDDIKRLCYY
jgi:hypothetical protein